MTATLKNLTIRQAAAACLFMAILAGALLVLLKTGPVSTVTELHAVLFMLFMLSIGIGTLGTFGILLWLAPDRTHAQRWFVRTMLFIGIGTLGTFGILLWLAPDLIIGFPGFIVFLSLLWITDGGQIFPPGW